MGLIDIHADGVYDILGYEQVGNYSNITMFVAFFVKLCSIK